MQVIANMRVLMTEDSNSAVSNSFLLDDDSRYDTSVGTGSFDWSPRHEWVNLFWRYASRL